MRGEYPINTAARVTHRELPPRARRILLAGFFRLYFGGTTSACAENTDRGKLGGSDHRNYLRVRGEYLMPR